MEEDKIESKYSPLVKVYQDKIEMLSSLIDRLEDTKRELDTKLALHQANNVSIKDGESRLSSLIDEIENKKNVAITVNQEATVLINKKLALEKESANLDSIVAQKKGYVADIEKYPAQVKLLQEEMEAFQNEHFTNKQNAEKELQFIKDEVKKIHDHIGLIL